MRGLHVLIAWRPLAGNDLAGGNHDTTGLGAFLAEPANVFGRHGLIDAFVGPIQRLVAAVMRDLEHVPAQPILIAVRLRSLDDVAERDVVHVGCEEDSGIGCPFPERGLENHGVVVPLLNFAVVEPPSHRVVDEDLQATRSVQVVEPRHQLSGVGDQMKAILKADPVLFAEVL